RKVAVLDALLHARRLVLVAVVFLRLGEAHRGESGLEERDVVAAAPEAIVPEDQAYRLLAELLLEPEAERAGRDRRVVRGEDARARVGGAVGRADDVVVELGAQRVSGGLEPLLEALAAEQALLFPREGGE